MDIIAISLCCILLLAWLMLTGGAQSVYREWIIRVVVRIRSRSQQRGSGYRQLFNRLCTGFAHVINIVEKYFKGGG